MTEAPTPAVPDEFLEAPTPAPIGKANVNETPRIHPRNPTVALLNKAHAQLNERKKLVEEELSRFDDLRKELGIINVQIDSLEVTLGVFAADNAPDVATQLNNAEAVEVPDMGKAPGTHTPVEFKGNKREFVKQIVESGGASGVTPPEIDQMFSDLKIPRSKNLIYNALSILVKQGSMRRKDGRYFPA